MRTEDDRVGISCRACNPGVSCQPGAAISGRISGETVNIPTNVVIGGVFLLLGIFFAPVILSATSGGRDYLSRAVSRKFA